MENNNQKPFWEDRWKDACDFETRISKASDDPLAAMLIRYAPRGGRVVDAGCGDGKHVFYFRQQGYEAYGVDYAEAAVRTCLEAAEQSGAAPREAFRMCDIRKMDFPDGYFAGYFSVGVLEHFEDGGVEAAREAFRVLAPGGVAFIAVPNLLSPWTPVRAFATRYQHLVYQKNISRFALRKRMERIGFRTTRCFNYDVAYALRASARMIFGLARSNESPKMSDVPVTLRGSVSYVEKVGNLLERIFPIFGYHTIYIGTRP